MTPSLSLAQRLAIALFTALVLGGCQALTDPDGYDQLPSPDQRLAALLDELESLRNPEAQPTAAENARQHERLLQVRKELEALSFEYPRHTDSAMAVAAFDYAEGEVLEAALRLDRLLQVEPVHLEAVLLRSQIAMEANNLPLARRLVEELLLHRPDSGEARESYAAVLFLEGDYAGAEQQLEAGLALGSPEWRIAYHRGLVAEHAGSFEEARAHYARAEEWEEARSAARARRLGVEQALGLEIQR